MAKTTPLLNRISRRLILATGVTRGDTARARVFRRYYDKNTWGDAESRSGAGSNMKQTEIIRRSLPALFEKWEIESLLDLPCGDGHWWRLVDHGLKSYHGADVVPELIAIRQSEARARETFECLDVVKDTLPRADAILCRDLLVHLSYDVALKSLGNMRDSGAEYLISTTFPGRKNRDIKTGSWRAIDLCAPPFNFPAPLELLNEGCTEDNGRFADKSLGVWRLGDIPVATTRA